MMDVYLREYEKLKDEQALRIGFRDNLIYATLVALGGIMSFALSSQSNIDVLLVLPVACIVLGWTYLANDRKISSIGTYVRLVLSRRISELLPQPPSEMFAWETFHLQYSSRNWQKTIQLCVDELTFVGAGVIALIVYYARTSGSRADMLWLIIVEALVLGILGIEIARAGSQTGIEE